MCVCVVATNAVAKAAWCLQYTVDHREHLIPATGLAPGMSWIFRGLPAVVDSETFPCPWVRPYVWNKFRGREAVFLGDHSSSVFIFIIHIPLSFQDVGLFPTCMCRCPRTGHGGRPLVRCSCRHPFVGAFLPCASARAGDALP